MARLRFAAFFAVVVFVATLRGSNGNVKTLATQMKHEINYVSNRANQVIDVVFVLDESGSVGPTNFKRILTFVRNTLDQFTVAPGYATPAVVTFGSGANLDIGLDHYGEKCKFIDRLSKTVKYTAGMTNMNEGFKVAYQELSQRQRSSSLKLVILISDGWYNEGGDPKPIADAMKSKFHAYVVAVGIGRYVLIL